jgi:hypothetical protein
VLCQEIGIAQDIASLSIRDDYTATQNYCALT